MKPIYRILLFNYFTLVFCILGTNSVNAQYFPVRDRMQTESLNGTWKIQVFAGMQVPDSLKGWLSQGFNTDNWQQVQVPGNWETAINKLKPPEYGSNLSAYTGLYRRTFNYNPIWEETNRHVILRFDGVNFSYTVFINGQKVGSWGSSFNMAQFDITPYLIKDHKNLLCVQVTTRSLTTQPKNTWQFDTNDDWSLSGISRDVTLYTLADNYLKDIKFTTEVLKNDQAKIALNISMGSFNNGQKIANGGLQVMASLVDPLNLHVIDFRSNAEENQDTIHFSGILKNPKLWTAETPNLYRLEVSILDANGKLIQRTHQKVGLRSIKVEGFQLKINNVPIHLHGVCLSEIDPKLGRAITYQVRLKQLQMMKAAGINFIRTAHYPFGPDFYALCDQLGFYVCDEIPFGFGDKNLNDTVYLPELMARAKATITRDKNHPSVIIWSIGNENPYTSVVEKVIQYVKQTDPSRPRGLPQRGSDYLRYQGKQSPNVDIYMPHYLGVSQLNASLKQTDKPLILTEYAHSLGLAMDEFEEQYANILAQPKIIGGSVWCWKDQALLRENMPTGNNKVQEDLTRSMNNLRHRATNHSLLSPPVQRGVQIDQGHYLDNSGNNGADGIVYGDDYPQEDYFLVRKLYSPVQILTDSLHAFMGKENKFSIQIANRFDFKDLNGYLLQWTLTNLDSTIDQGTYNLNVPVVIPPDSRKRITLKMHLPALSTADNALEDFTLHLKIIDPNGMQMNEKNITFHKGNFLREFKSISKNKALHFAVSKKGVLTVFDKDKVILNTPLYMRVGRKLTITSESQTTKDHFNWEPYILIPKVDNLQRKYTDSGLAYILACHWESPSSDVDHRGVSGKIEIRIRSNNVVELRYFIHPFKNATGNLLECGLALDLEKIFHTFHWLGAGPFSSSTGKTAFNERDIWALDKEDIRFNGNRAGVAIAEASTFDSTGIGLWSSNGNIGIENIQGRMMISQNAVISGYGSKFKAPKGRAPVSTLHNITGTLMLQFSTQESPVLYLNKIFDPYKRVNPENPYLDSYGW